MRMRRLVALALVAGAVAGFLIALLRPRPRQPHAVGTATGVPTSPVVAPGTGRTGTGSTGTDAAATGGTDSGSTDSDATDVDATDVDVTAFDAQERASTDAGPDRVARG